MKKRTALILAAAAIIALPGCFTITGSIDIPGGQGKAPIGTIGFSHTWPQTFTQPVITGVTIKGEPTVVTPATIKAEDIEAPLPKAP